MFFIDLFDNILCIYVLLRLFERDTVCFDVVRRLIATHIDQIFTHIIIEVVMSVISVRNFISLLSISYNQDYHAIHKI